jgi:hypothetical protein
LRRRCLTNCRQRRRIACQRELCCQRLAAGDKQHTAYQRADDDGADRKTRHTNSSKSVTHKSQIAIVTTMPSMMIAPKTTGRIRRQRARRRKGAKLSV